MCAKLDARQGGPHNQAFCTEQTSQLPRESRFCEEQTLVALRRARGRRDSLSSCGSVELEGRRVMWDEKSGPNTTKTRIWFMFPGHRTHCPQYKMLSPYN